MTGATPELRALSTNVCPNAGPDWMLLDGRHCSSVESSMTTWGYCGMCWENGWVPSLWAARVDAAIDAARTEALR